MTADAADLMRHNLTLCANQMLDLAAKAKSPDDQALFNKAAETYKRLKAGLPK